MKHNHEHPQWLLYTISSFWTHTSNNNNGPLFYNVLQTEILADNR